MEISSTVWFLRYGAQQTNRGMEGQTQKCV